MRKAVLFAFILCGCARPEASRIANVRSVIMRDADAYILMVSDGAGNMVPRKVFAEWVRIAIDVPQGHPIWAEYIDAPGELRGEGDRLILHVRSMEDIVH